MSSPRHLAALLVFVALPLMAPAAATADPPAPSAHRPPCAWLNPLTKGYAFCLAQHEERERKLTAQSDVPDAPGHAADLPSHTGDKDRDARPRQTVHDTNG
jgi:hypothetical protein